MPQCGIIGTLENRVSDARARYDRAKQLDGMRQSYHAKIAAALSELAQPEIRGKLGNDGLAMIASLKSFQDTLSGFDSVRLIDRPDYSDALAATDDALVKRWSRFAGQFGGLAKVDFGFDYAANFSSFACLA